MSKRIGIIGFGTRMMHIAKNEFGKFPELEVVAVADINLESAKALMSQVSTIDIGKVNLYEDAIEMLNKEKLDGVFVATRCDLHKKYATEVLERKIPLFLEKPVVQNMDDYYALKKTVEETDAVGVTSFPLRITTVLQKVKEIYESGVLGTLSQVQAYNNVFYGRVYYKNWYRDDSITGGLFLQKSTHDIDYINYVLGKSPVEVCAMESKTVYKGDKPANLKCADCPEYETCYESTKVIGGHDDPMGEYCSYGCDVGNHDSATVLMRYSDGMHAVYTQNFVARHLAGKRGMRMIGQRATVEFDWETEEVILFKHDEHKKETFVVKPPEGSGHSGGDYALVRDFDAVMNGDRSVSSLTDGLESAYICMKVRESAEKHQFITL